MCDRNTLQDEIRIPPEWTHLVQRPLRHQLLAGFRGMLIMEFNRQIFREDIRGADRDEYTQSIVSGVERIKRMLKSYVEQHLSELPPLRRDWYEHDA